MNGSYVCPKTKSTVNLDEPVHSGNQDASNINEFWSNYDPDLDEIVIRGEKFDPKLFVHESVKYVLVMEKIMQMRKYRYCEDERKKMYATIASGGVMDIQTVNFIKAVWNKITKQNNNNKKFPVLVQVDTNPNGYSNALLLKEAGVDVCLVLGDKECLQKYGISEKGELSEKDTKILEEMFDESDLLKRDERECNGTYVNAEQHCSFKHPCLITIMLNENDIKIESFEDDDEASTDE